MLTMLVVVVARADSLPPYDGTMVFPEIKGPSDPQDFSWQVILHEGQALEQLDDQTAVVYYERDLEPALLITATLAHDAVGTNVPTTLAVSGSDVITLTVHHRDGNPLAGGAPFAYPIVAGSGWEGGFQTSVHRTKQNCGPCESCMKEKRRKPHPTRRSPKPASCRSSKAGLLRRRRRS